ncbi:hypothetical protein [Sporolactobacillus spathodeae]|uniref:Uncharacterized protein n=1 Tax=Sporolactobacillus spathodeae TaxID=1465502 RepID=A0ABS2Q554_9BACL|nr:hypothetical protein [Sporolactobacillus spathodeae]MBM7656565.1 hypothetical protein [Sporolactobacillus spathodeae]
MFGTGLIQELIVIVVILGLTQTTKVLFRTHSWMTLVTAFVISLGCSAFIDSQKPLLVFIFYVMLHALTAVGLYATLKTMMVWYRNHKNESFR